MENQISVSSTQNNRRFLLKRIDARDIEITNPQRMEVLKMLSGGVRFIQLGDITIMANGIRCIEPIEEEQPRFDYFDEHRFLPPTTQELTDQQRKQARDNIAKLKKAFKNKEVES